METPPSLTQQCVFISIQASPCSSPSMTSMTTWFRTRQSSCWSCVVHPRGGLGKDSLVAVQSFSVVQLFATPWTAAHQVPLSLGFYRQEYWSGSPFPSPGNLPDPGIEPSSFMSPALAGGFFTSSATWEALFSEGL